MSKLPAQHRFVDLSDYGRPVARWLVHALAPLGVTSLQLTFAFLIAGAFGIVALGKGYYLVAALLLVVKSILDAADGEMARYTQKPSQTGRYLDSIFDFAINFALLLVICHVAGLGLGWFVAGFISMELQGTVYNHYYVIQRKLAGGDTTSVVDESALNTTYDTDKPAVAHALRRIFLLLYRPFDSILLFLDRQAEDGHILPKWFMTLVSFYGLGFQLLVVGILLSLDRLDWIIPFFLWANFGMLMVVGIRKLMGSTSAPHARTAE